MTGVAKVHSAAPVGFEGSLIELECDLKRGLPSIQIVGLGNKAIDEAKERVRSAIANSLLEVPARKIIVNLAPAELPKDGSHYDLPIALSILVASGQLRQSEVNKCLFAGELALDGAIRSIKGVITLAEVAKKSGMTTLYLPKANTSQAQLVKGVAIIGITSLKELFLHLKKESLIPPESAIEPSISVATPQYATTIDDIHGQAQAKRAMIIAAAGHHNILLNGSPGAGKTMLASTLPSLLPKLSDEESLAVTKLHSLNGSSLDEIIRARPFRSPHHSASRTALIGGGTHPKPGEISLAHLGVLFLDEIPEYPRSILESLRQPLEDHSIAINRAHGSLRYPANFMLVATMNPCPCGYYGDSDRECTCSSMQIQMYQKKLSGPLLDRIDMTITVPRVPTSELLHQKPSQNKQHNGAYVLIEKAYAMQRNRYKRSDVHNADLSTRSVQRSINLNPATRILLDKAAEQMKLSARSYFKVIKVARTIADLDQAPAIHENHVAEALQYRQFSS